MEKDKKKKYIFTKNSEYYFNYTGHKNLYVYPVLKYIQYKKKYEKINKKINSVWYFSFIFIFYFVNAYIKRRDLFIKFIYVCEIVNVLIFI